MFCVPIYFRWGYGGYGRFVLFILLVLRCIICLFHLCMDNWRQFYNSIPSVSVFFLLAIFFSLYIQTHPPQNSITEAIYSSGFNVYIYLYRLVSRNSFDVMKLNMLWCDFYCRLGHREQKDEWSPRRVDVFTRHNVLPPNAVVSAGSVSSSCTAGTIMLLL